MYDDLGILMWMFCGINSGMEINKNREESLC